MTLEQLKQHIDRRLDRLQRTKANKADLRRFATKQDLKRFATKDDLKPFVTKSNLSTAIGRVEERIATIQKILEGIVRHHGIVLDDHEVRIRDLERRV